MSVSERQNREQNLKFNNRFQRIFKKKLLKKATKFNIINKFRLKQQLGSSKYSKLNKFKTEFSCKLIKNFCFKIIPLIYYALKLKRHTF